MWLGGDAAIEHKLSVGVLVGARIAPLAWLAPWLAMRATPAVVRGALTLALTVALGPLALATAPERVPSGVVLLALAAREIVLGTVFAVACAVPLYALDWAGRLVDTWRGASPLGGREQTAPLGTLYVLLGVALFAGLGGYRLAFGAFAQGLLAAPVGDPALGGSVAAVALGVGRLVASALGFAVALAAPAGVAIVVVETALGLLGRAAPQMPVFFAGMPLRAAVGLGAALLALSAVAGELPEAFRHAIDVASALIRALGS